MRFGFVGSCPLHLVPFSSFVPLLHLWSPLFFHVLLSISSFSSFARTLAPALVCTRTSTYILNTQVFTMRWSSSVVPVHLVSLSLQPHTFLSRLVLLLMSSSFCPCRAHIYTAVLALILFASPRGGVCVSPLESRGSFWTVLFLDVLSAGGVTVDFLATPMKLQYGNRLDGSLHANFRACCLKLFNSFSLSLLFCLLAHTGAYYLPPTSDGLQP